MSLPTAAQAFAEVEAWKAREEESRKKSLTVFMAKLGDAILAAARRGQTSVPVDWHGRMNADDRRQVRDQLSELGYGTRASDRTLTVEW